MKPQPILHLLALAALLCLPGCVTPAQRRELAQWHYIVEVLGTTDPAPPAEGGAP